MFSKSNASHGDEPKVTPEIAAEAAVWIARLHGPSRSAQMERDFLAWQERSAAHRRAFEATTDVWEAVPQIKLTDAYASLSARSTAPGWGWSGGGDRWRSRTRRWPLLVALPVIGIAISAYLAFWPQGDVYATKIGDQRQVALDDGSRMTLNTNTRIRVSYSSNRRDIEVDQGEALFEVAKDPLRPFVVHAGGSAVVAVGTVFSVRLADGGDRSADALAVTLIEGKVVVQPDPSGWAKGVAPDTPVQMIAGDRVRLAKEGGSSEGRVKPQLDRPRVQQVLAWQQGAANFDDVPLPDAVAEMNRYSRTPIALAGDPSLSKLRVSGLFRTGDNTSFANAVATVHGLHVRQLDGRLELTLPH